MHNEIHTPLKYYNYKFKFSFLQWNSTFDVIFEFIFQLSGFYGNREILRLCENLYLVPWKSQEFQSIRNLVLF